MKTFTKKTLKIIWEYKQVAVEGYVYTDNNKRKLFVHKCLNNKRTWSVSEPYTGLALGRTQDSSRVKAISNAVTRLKEMVDNKHVDWNNLIKNNINQL